MATDPKKPKVKSTKTVPAGLKKVGSNTMQKAKSFMQDKATGPNKMTPANKPKAGGLKMGSAAPKTGGGTKTGTNTGGTTSKTSTTTPKYSYTYGNQISKSDSASLAFDMKQFGNKKNPETTLYKGDKGLQERTIYTAKDPKTGNTIKSDAFQFKKMQQKYNIPAKNWKESKEQRTVSRTKK